MSKHNEINLSPFTGFSKLTFKERLSKLKFFAGLSADELEALAGDAKGLTIHHAEHLIENVIGVFSLPLGVATHFKIDGRDVLIPMAVEETSIIAAVSGAAKWVRKNGGFKTKSLGNLIIGQVQFPSLQNTAMFRKKIEENTDDLIAKANAVIPNLVLRGGGVVGIQVREISRPDGKTMGVLHILCNPCNAMGANLINQVCEAMKIPLEKLTGEKIGLCILSNLVDTKLCEATCEIEDITPELGKAIEQATMFANLDPYRCATHNKGVMNGIDPILIATGNDWRAVEAGIHAYIAMNGKYHSITDWKYTDGKLKGVLTAPLAVGTVGGVTQIHPTAKACIKILGVEHADELARICAATGLAQNLAALKALCTVGIVEGHMKLHAANLALAAGAIKHEIHIVQEKLKKEKRITLTRAKELLLQIRQESSQAVSV